jgi:hypothetical protein
MEPGAQAYVERYAAELAAAVADLGDKADDGL